MKFSACQLFLSCSLMFFSLSSFAGNHSVWFNSGANNRDITFSPDGSLMLTTIMLPRNLSSAIVFAHKVDDVWSALVVAPFSGTYADIEPAFSPDGKYLFFASKRPRPERDGTDWDLWRVSYTGGTWGKPENLGEPVNTSGNEFYPSIADNGNLYFTATRSEGLGKEDLYVSPAVDGSYKQVVNLGEPVNSAAYEFNAFIAPDESYIIFGSQGREQEIGGGDLYISYRAEKGFAPGILLSRRINSSRLDYCPTVWQDRLYYTTEKSADIDTSSMEAINTWYLSPGNGLGDIYWLPLSEITD